MPNRRTFLATLGLAIAGTTPLLAGPERRRERWEMLASNEPPVSSPHRPDPRAWTDSTITASWIGHSTVLVNFFGTWIITDPVFSERIGLSVAGLFTVGPRRLVQPALAWEDLPPIDLIVLSHAHLDHCDLPTLRRFDRAIPVVIAKNIHDVIEELNFQTVYELDWGQWTQLGGLRVEALEVKHFGWRYPWEPDRSRGFQDGRSYNAYLLTKNGRSIVFGGDTAYHEHFREIQNRGIDVDLAIMPIGAYDPWIRNHINPEQAVAMAEHLGASAILPIHWGTFIQSEEPTEEPIQRLKKAGEGRLALEAIGQTWTLPPLTHEETT
jgi:L-ascorbate metabolism protein UlaG (beta-lactamase superfamily)